jgi:hypothetical protein
VLWSWLRDLARTWRRGGGSPPEVDPAAVAPVVVAPAAVASAPVPEPPVPRPQPSRPTWSLTDGARAWPLTPGAPLRIGHHRSVDLRLEDSPPVWAEVEALPQPWLRAQAPGVRVGAAEVPVGPRALAAGEVVTLGALRLTLMQDAPWAQEVPALEALALRLARHGEEQAEGLAASAQRTSVLAALALWRRLPAMHGLGLEARLVELRPVSLHELADLRFELDSVDRMDSFQQEAVRSSLTLRRVVREGGAWRVAELFEPALLAQLEAWVGRAVTRR